MAQAIRIPEILCLICEQAQRSDLARLLTTSRLFFDCAAPFIWKSLPESAPMILMKLLPDGDKHLKHRLKNKFIGDLQPLSAESLARFKLYAPYVKKVTHSNKYGLWNRVWNKLRKLVDSRPILPNLEIIQVSISGRVQDPVSYIAAYLSTTLVEINYTPCAHPFVEPQHLSDFVSNIAQQCPKIHTLKLGYVDRHVAIGPLHADELANSFSRLHNLQVLGLGPVTLNPKLLIALGSLPNLKSITLNETPNSGWLDSDATLRYIDGSLPHDFFPNLQHLGIDPCLELESVTRMWNITALVRDLKSVYARIAVNWLVTQLQLHDFVSTMCRNSPSVSSLFLGCTRVRRPIELLTPEIIDNLAQLPLRNLWLHGEDGCNGFICPRWDSEQFALGFSRVEYLRVTGYYLTFKDLTFIAKHMTQLQRLKLTIEIYKDWPSTDELRSLSITPSSSQLYIQLGITHHVPGHWVSTPVIYTLSSEKVEAIAAGLHALWPKGTICGPYRRLGENGELSCVEEVSTALRRLRGVDGHSNQVEVWPVARNYKGIPPWLERF